MTSWEQRMSARASKRRTPLDDIHEEVREAEAKLQRLQSVERSMRGMTRVEAKRILAYEGEIACACVGGPSCCRITFEAARRLVEE